MPQKKLFEVEKKKEVDENEVHVFAHVIRSYPEEILDMDGHFVRLELGKTVPMTKRLYKMLKELGYVR